MYRIALCLLFVVLAAEASVVYKPGYKRRGRGYEPPVSDYGNGGNGYGDNGYNGGNGGNGYGDNAETVKTDMAKMAETEEMVETTE